MDSAPVSSTRMLTGTISKCYDCGTPEYLHRVLLLQSGPHKATSHVSFAEIRPDIFAPPPNGRPGKPITESHFPQVSRPILEITLSLGRSAPTEPPQALALVGPPRSTSGGGQFAVSSGMRNVRPPSKLSQIITTRKGRNPKKSVGTPTRPGTRRVAAFRGISDGGRAGDACAPQKAPGRFMIFFGRVQAQPIDLTDARIRLLPWRSRLCSRQGWPI